MHRVFVSAVLALLLQASPAAGQRFTPEDVKGNPDFTPNKIYTHLLQGEWVLKRQRFQKDQARTVLCQTEYFLAQEVGHTTQVLGRVRDDHGFCAFFTERFRAVNSVDFVSVLVVNVDRSMQKALHKPNAIQAPDGNVKLFGYSYHWADCGNSKFLNDDAVNHLVCEIYSLKHIVGFLGKVKRPSDSMDS